MGVFSNIKAKLSEKLGEMLGMNEGLTFKELKEFLESKENLYIYGERSRHLTIKDNRGIEFYIEILNITRFLASMNIEVNPVVEYVAVRLNGSMFISVVELEVVEGRRVLSLSDDLVIPMEYFRDMVYTELGRATVMSLSYKNIEEVMKEYYTEVTEEKTADERNFEETVNDWDNEDSWGYLEYKNVNIVDYK